MRYAMDGRPVVRLVFELVEDRETLPDNADKLSFDEWLDWNKAQAPPEAAVKAAFGRLQEVAEALRSDLDVLYQSIEPVPLHVLREGDPELLRPMLPVVRVERIEIWDGDERYPEPEEAHLG